jgi:RimJ/RimL family protein N-acetyltransferase
VAAGDTTPQVETSRLIGEPLDVAHEAALCALLSDPRVGLWLGGISTPAQVRLSIERQLRAWAERGFGIWAWRERSTGLVVARGGLQPIEIEGRPEIEVGWTVAADRWGQGYATELGAASVAFAFDALGLPDLVSVTLPQNRRSRRVMEKLGFAHERDAYVLGFEQVVYRRRAADRPPRGTGTRWRSSATPPPS